MSYIVEKWIKDHDTCPDCGYTICDCMIHKDHNLCKNPKLPNTPYGWQWDETKQQFKPVRKDDV